MAEMKNMKVEVVRYNPEVDIAPHSAFYEVPYDEQTSLLDALGYIKDNLAPDLSCQNWPAKPSCANTPKALKSRRWLTSRLSAIWWSI